MEKIVSIRAIVTWGIFIASASCALCYCVYDVNYFVILIGLLYGLGTGLTCTLTPVLLNERYPPEQRTLVSSRARESYTYRGKTPNSDRKCTCLYSLRFPTTISFATLIGISSNDTLFTGSGSSFISRVCHKREREFRGWPIMILGMIIVIKGNCFWPAFISRRSFLFRRTGSPFPDHQSDRSSGHSSWNGSSTSSISEEPCWFTVVSSQFRHLGNQGAINRSIVDTTASKSDKLSVGDTVIFPDNCTS